MLEYYLKRLPGEAFEKLSHPEEGCWIHVDQADAHDLRTLGDLLELDYFDLQDCLDKHEIPRIEKVNSYLFIFTRHPIDQEVGLYTSTVTLILTKKYFISISPHKCPWVHMVVQQQSCLSTLHKSELLIHLLLKISHEFTQQIKRVRYNVLEQQKEMILVDSDDIAALTRNEEVLNQYLSSLLPMRAVLDEITSGRYTILDEKNQELLDDLRLAIQQSENLCSINLKSIRSLRDSYQIIFTNNLHKTIKLLTALTIILSIPTMVASLYGMNVRLPFESNPYAFLIVLLLILLFSLGSFYLFERKRWL